MPLIHFSCFSKPTANNAETQNKIYYLNSILHLDGFTLNVIIENRDKINIGVRLRDLALTPLVMCPCKASDGMQTGPRVRSQSTVDASSSSSLLQPQPFSHSGVRTADIDGCCTEASPHQHCQHGEERFVARRAKAAQTSEHG